MKSSSSSLQRRGLAPQSVSFAGCAWLFPYHLGVYEALKQHPDFVNANYLGASSGSLAAVIASLGLEGVQVLEEVIRFAKDAESRRLGPVGQMSRYVWEGLRQVLPEEAFLRAGHRLWISVTELPWLRPRLIAASACSSNDELLYLLLGSCYIPVYYERPVRWRQSWLIDGGIRNNQPAFDVKTILVSPTASNVKKANEIRPDQGFGKRVGLFPISGKLEGIYRTGFIDALKFLESWEPTRFADETSLIGAVSMPSVRT